MNYADPDLLWPWIRLYIKLNPRPNFNFTTDELFILMSKGEKRVHMMLYRESHAVENPRGGRRDGRMLVKHLLQILKHRGQLSYHQRKYLWALTDKAPSDVRAMLSQWQVPNPPRLSQ